MMKVDLKCYDDGNYRKLGGVLRNVLEAISTLKESGVWVEIVTLLVPGFNDSPRELRELARFIISVSPDIPWHVTAFHQDYRMTDPSNTTSEQLLAAANLGREEGIRFVYAGNLPGHVGEFENTNCPECQALLIKRFGFAVLEDHLTGSGTCPRCKAGIPGIWM
jgi:pyruvate formate lyase activating enzyme